MTLADRRLPWWAGWTAVALLAGFGVWQVTTASEPAAGGPPPLPAAAIVASPVPPPVVATTATVPAVPALSMDRSIPIKVVIPSIALRSGLGSVRTKPDGTIETPSHELRNRAMWFASGPAPGEPGPAVIVGHVDSKGQVAVFFYLTRVRPGQQIEITRQDRRTAVFTVDSIEQFAKSAFPTERVYGSTEGSELRLITCGGAYDRVKANWTANVIVFARLTAIRPA